MKSLIIALLLIPTLCFASDKVRVQVITDGDAFYYPKDKYCSPEQVARIQEIVGFSNQAVEEAKAERVEARRVAAEIEAAKPVVEPTKEDLEAQIASLQSQRAEIEAQISVATEAVLTAKPREIKEEPKEEPIEEIIK